MRRIALVVGFGAVLVGAVAVRSCGHADRTDSPRNASTEAATVEPVAQRTGPRSIRDGVSVGWSRDPDGARAAAVSAVALTGALARAGFITRGDMIEVLASTRYAPVLTRTAESQLDDLLGDLPAAGIATASALFRELPLTATVGHADDTTARVEVWSVLVVGAAERGAPRQLWRTVTVDLLWEGDDWRVDGWAVVAGPTPALATSSPVATVDDLVRVTSWPPAMES